MNGETTSTRYHGEIKVIIGGNEARINVFSNTLAELFKDLAQIHAQFGKADPISNPAKRAIVNAEIIAARQAKAQSQTEIPTCPNCETADDMELIEFIDKKTNKPKKAWKCHQCQEWYWPDAKGRER